jgi:predicted ATPase
MPGVSQPSGQVTLVFTDIEGSTRLLEELGIEAYRVALAEHRAIVRKACERHAGYEVDYEGDAFFFAFASPRDAIAAVSEAMAGIERSPIRVRVGIHTGQPELDPPKYVGIDVHLAARIMATAHGGQVVVSSATAGLVDAELTDLGEHRLRDIAEPVSIYQLGEGSFPPLETISNTNLPRPASSFVGRATELREVLSRIEAGARLVTLTGPGGTGKTRLALEAAATLIPQYKAGVFWVALATLRDPALVSDTIAQTLGAKDGLAAHIGGRELVLLLDNLEQVVEAARELSALLSACPNLTVLCTSRELLRIEGEVEYPVPPLAEAEAVDLFSARAQREPSHEIAELCARLDNLPLAVELAAARTNALTPAQILDRISGRLDLLKGGRDADPRQQTLRATIEWSNELLSPAEQQLFARLSVFAGGCTLEAAEDVAGADLDTLQSLVEKSLLRFTPSEAGSRYWMLETIREYAGERLDQDPEVLAIRGHHAEWVADLTGRLAPQLRESTQREAFLRLDDEIDNLRAAMDWLECSGDARAAARLVLDAHQYMWRRDHAREMMPHFERLLAEQLAPDLRVRLLGELGSEFTVHGRPDAAIPLIREAARVASELEDRYELRRAQYLLAHALAESGSFDEATELFEAVIAEAESAGEEHGVALAKWAIADICADDNRSRALALLDDALVFHREVDDSLGVAWIQASRADLLWSLASSAEALDALAESLTTYASIGVVAGVANAFMAVVKLLAGSHPSIAAAALKVLDGEVGTQLAPRDRTRLKNLQEEIGLLAADGEFDSIDVLRQARDAVTEAVAGERDRGDAVCS